MTDVDPARTDGSGSPDAARERPPVVVALSNPATAGALAGVAATIAAHRDGRVLAAHVVRVPDQTPLAAAATDERRDGDGDAVFEAAHDAVAALGLDVPVTTTRILSHRGLPEVFDAAGEYGATALVMGSGGARRLRGRAEGAVAELTGPPPCDVLVLDGDRFDPSRVLVPTAGGHSSDLSAEVARAVREAREADVSLLHVAEAGDADGDAARRFLETWADTRDLADATRRVESGDVGSAVDAAAADATLVVIGATERGVLARLVGGSRALSVLADLDTPVLMVERPRARSWFDRLLRRR